MQVPVPEQPEPDQPANSEPAAGVAVKVTCCPAGKLAWHVLPQSIPDGELVTVPAPAPALVTLSVAGTMVSAIPAPQVAPVGLLALSPL